MSRKSGQCVFIAPTIEHEASDALKCRVYIELERADCSPVMELHPSPMVMVDDIGSSPWFMLGAPPVPVPVEFPVISVRKAVGREPELLGVPDFVFGRSLSAAAGDPFGDLSELLERPRVAAGLETAIRFLNLLSEERQRRRDDAVWDKLNQRRLELIDRDIGQGLSVSERAELEDLEKKADDYLDKVAPLPFEMIEKLKAALAEDGLTVDLD
jgi:hypothetical protein